MNHKDCLFAPETVDKTHAGAPQISATRAIDLYSEAELANLLDTAKSSADGVFGDILSTEESNRINILKRLYTGFEGPSRTLLVGTEDVVERLDRLKKRTPSFRKVVDLYRREALSSWRTGAPMRMTPLILLGPPGVGKTHLVNALALALGVPFVSIAMSTCDDIGDIVGHSPSWKSARPGKLANTLMECGFASPIVLVDELEKAPILSHNDRPSDVWHSLFEPENARNFRDEFLGLSMRADHVLWVATANSLDALPESVVDRTLVMNVDPPNFAESRVIAKSLFAAFVDERPGIHKQLPEEALAILAGHTPRTMKKILLVAAGIAAERQSSAIEASDIEAALSVIDMPRNPDRRFGFL